MQGLRRVSDPFDLARFVAAQRDQSYEELDAAVTANAARVFGWGA